MDPFPYFPAVIWLLMAGAVIVQVAYGVVLDRAWRPWYRRSENPIGFWSVIAIQTVLLLGLAIVWIVIIRSDSHG